MEYYTRGLEELCVREGGHHWEEEQPRAARECPTCTGVWQTHQDYTGVRLLGVNIARRCRQCNKSQQGIEYSTGQIEWQENLAPTLTSTPPVFIEGAFQSFPGYPTDFISAVPLKAEIQEIPRGDSSESSSSSEELEHYD